MPDGGIQWHRLQSVDFHLILAIAAGLGWGMEPHRLKSVPLGMPGIFTQHPNTSYAAEILPLRVCR